MEEIWDGLLEVLAGIGVLFFILSSWFWFAVGSVSWILYAVFVHTDTMHYICLGVTAYWLITLCISSETKDGLWGG
ncbi:hypothetical protein [Paenibacillus sp. BC26]|uniref:hypothetical protein n=1 Tax=Paenibacillus sp. BC26 TaxID=1881032 RepID=UPI0008F108AE|nr:hypothetical protein [Paenibacillus sp. BC26]SFS69953.1 hypothetical protein SAMN05428962_2357 [Paenibacillus sp. BC26]